MLRTEETLEYYKKDAERSKNYLTRVKYEKEHLALLFEKQKKVIDDLTRQCEAYREMIRKWYKIDDLVKEKNRERKLRDA